MRVEREDMAHVGGGKMGIVGGEEVGEVGRGEGVVGED